MLLVRITLKCSLQPVDIRCDCVGFIDGNLFCIRKKGLPINYSVGLIEKFNVVVYD